jgi:hypothetical protein
MDGTYNGKTPGGVAVGGTWTIGLNLIEGAYDSDFKLPFEALPPDNMKVASSTIDTVTVHALSAGADYLRIVEPDTHLLYDRLWIQATPVEELTLWPARGQLYLSEPFKWGLLAGETSVVGVTLCTAQQGCLIDEGAEIQLDGQVVPKTTTWDEREVTVPAASSTEVSVKLGSGAVLSKSVPIVAAVDDIVSVDDRCATGAKRKLYEGQACCYKALSGDMMIDTESWSYSADPELGAKKNKINGQNCLYFVPSTEGNAAVAVSVGGVVKLFVYKLVP